MMEELLVYHQYLPRERKTLFYVQKGLHRNLLFWEREKGDPEKKMKQDF